MNQEMIGEIASSHALLQLMKKYLYHMEQERLNVENAKLHVIHASHVLLQRQIAIQLNIQMAKQEHISVLVACKMDFSPRILMNLMIRRFTSLK